MVCARPLLFLAVTCQRRDDQGDVVGGALDGTGRLTHLVAQPG
jgi:hypothetical protein